MEFKGVIKDAKVSADKVSVNVLGGEGLSIDELRMYFGEPVTIKVEVIQPPLPIDSTEGYQVWVDSNGEVLG